MESGIILLNYKASSKESAKSFKSSNKGSYSLLLRSLKGMINFDYPLFYWSQFRV
ncbi:hypothetical protein PMI10_02108, partial [Flavobacterium sp. CF136]